MSWKDTATGYGWVSIALHWITFVSITLLLYFGSSIGAYEGAERQQMLRLHISTAVLSYVFLWARVVWRFVYGHPGPTEEQGKIAFFVGKWVHLSMVVVLAVMLITGPLTAWFYGYGVGVFDWFSLPSPFPESSSVGMRTHMLHRWMAVALFIGILLHLGGVYKHIAFNQDGTFTKMLFPARQPAAESRSAPDEHADAGAADAAEHTPAGGGTERPDRERS